MTKKVENLFFEYIRNDIEQGGSDLLPISDYIFDQSAILVLSEFYNQNKSYSLSEFLNSNFSVAKFFKKYHWIENTYIALESQFKEFSILQDVKSVRILGDPHPNFTTKYSSKNFIYSHLPFSKINTIFYNLSQIIGKDSLNNLFPEFIEESEGIYKRKLLISNNNFRSEQELSDYYESFGSGMAILLLFRSIDNYYENILISNKKPVFFDHECIFTNKIKGEESEPYGYQHTGTINPLGKSFDTSSLTGAINNIQSLLKPYIIGSDTQPRIKWINKINSKGNHIPLYNRNIVNVSTFKTKIEEGIITTKTLIMNNLVRIKDMVAVIKLRPRVLIRASSFYKSLLVGYPYAYLQSNINLNDYIYGELLKNTPILSGVIIEKEMIEYEVESLSLGLIPIFYQDIHSKNIFSSDGRIIAKLKDTSESIWLEHLNHYPELIDKTLDRIKKL